MAEYRPQGLWQATLSGLSAVPGWLGFKARKKLHRAYVKRALGTFEALEVGLGPDDICIDLGANYGVFTRQLAKTGAQVHAFEPDPDTFAILKENVGDLPNVALHQRAVAQTGGTLTLHRLAEGLASTAEKRSWGSSLIASDRSSATDTVDVDVVSFDQMLAEMGGPVKLIKMDIEGAEVEILHAVTSNPSQYDIGTLFVETHERQRPEQLPDVLRLRRLAADIERPDIHLYWP